jgi:porphobilinogen deaminase
VKPLIIGTRGSPLALAQSEIVKSLLRRAHPPLPVEIKIIKTSGDIFPSISSRSNCWQAKLMWRFTA